MGYSQTGAYMTPTWKERKIYIYTNIFIYTIYMLHLLSWNCSSVDSRFFITFCRASWWKQIFPGKSPTRHCLLLLFIVHLTGDSCILQLIQCTCSRRVLSTPAADKNTKRNSFLNKCATSLALKYRVRNSVIRLQKNPKKTQHIQSTSSSHCPLYMCGYLSA